VNLSPGGSPGFGEGMALTKEQWEAFKVFIESDDPYVVAARKAIEKEVDDAILDEMNIPCQGCDLAWWECSCE